MCFLIWLRSDSAMPWVYTHSYTYLHLQVCICIYVCMFMHKVSLPILYGRRVYLIAKVVVCYQKRLSNFIMFITVQLKEIYSYRTFV